MKVPVEQSPIDDAVASPTAEKPNAGGRGGRPPAPAKRRRGTVYALRLLVLVLIIGLWELLSGRVIDDFFISSPSKIVVEWWGWAVDGTLWYNAYSTLLSAVIGFVLGSVAALIIGYALGVSARLADVFEPYITAIYSLPRVALIPLFVIWLGIGRQLQFAVCGIVVFFLMFFNTYFGIRDVSRSLIDSMRIMGASRLDVATKVRLPSALVWVVAGLKLSVPESLVAVVVTEMLASNRGLGHLVSLNSGQFNTTGTFAALFTLLIIGIVIDRLVGLVTRRALVWKNDFRTSD